MEIDLSLPNKLFRGDSIDINGHLDIDLSDCIIRAEIFDRFGSSIKLSSEIEDEIEITNEEDGTFVIYIEKDTTDLFHLVSYLEIEVEDDDGKITTAYFSHIKFEDNIYLRG